MRSTGLTLFVAVILSIQSQLFSQDGIKVEVPQTTELAMIIAVLSDWDPEGRLIRRDGEYVEAIIRHFSDCSDHAILGLLGEDFSLPRLAGNAADFILDEEMCLVEVDSSGSIWGDTEGDLFRKHLTVIEDFARKSNFISFYNENRSLYQRDIDVMQSNIDGEEMISWLQKNFTARPGPLKIILSPLIRGFNWTTLFKPQTRVWLAPPKNARDKDISVYDKISGAWPIFTELDHSYVNPVTSKIIPRLEQGFTDLDVWTRKNSSSRDYPTAELQFNEYMTWSAYLLYANDKLPPADYAKVRQEIINIMVKGRGFIAFEDFSDEALKLYSSSNITAEEVLLKMADWTVSYVESR